MERLRALVASKSWDYCVVWRLSDDQRFIEWADCCCGGSASSGGDVEDREHDHYNGDHHHHHQYFPAVNAGVCCRDMMFQHQRTKSCDLLALLPSSIPLSTSGIHAHVLLSNQLSWLQFSNVLDSNVSEESLGTKVLVPVPGGLLELFVAKQVPEDEGVIDFILNYTQCGSNNVPVVMEQAEDRAGLNRVIHSTTQLEDQITNNNTNNNNFTSIMGSPGLYDEENNNTATNDYVMDEMKQYMRKEMAVEAAAAGGGGGGYVQNKAVVQVNDDEDDDDDDQKVMMKKEMNGGGGGRGGDSVSDCSDLNMEDELDDDQTGRYRRGGGSNGVKGPSSKNLVAERKRRKKLNDRLYKLRSLVPNISKLDRASILGDAIEFVRELENQVKELQDELAEQSDDDAGTKNSCVTSSLADPPPPDHNHHLYDNIINDKTQQIMEPQVEVAQIDGKEFFVKVFSEHKTGGFLRLMEVLDTLGLEVTNANVTSFRGLVSNVFKVEKKDSDILLQTEYVRDTLLEVTRNPSSSMLMSSGRWVDEMMKCPSTETNVATAEAGNCRHDHFHDHPQLITTPPTHHLHHFHT